MINKTILHYKITEKLGEGGMGGVFKAEDTRLKRAVAIKFPARHGIIGDDQRARFEIEARASAALSHPNVAHIYAIEEMDGEIFIVMELVRGSDLRNILSRGPLSLDEAIDIASQVARGLKAAHDAGIVHRDIKCANIMVTDQGNVKIMDFGLARMLGGDRVTRVGMTVGTTAFMSPEQARGEEVDHRTDIWSLGVVLYEMLTGAMPFRGDYEQAILYSILNENPDPVSSVAAGLPPEADKLVSRLLAKDRDGRFQRMDDVVAGLESLKQAIAPPAPGARAEAPRPRELPVLAVLPFSSIKSDPETAFLGFALADQIIGALTYVDSIVVRPSSAVRKYQDQPIDVPTAGRELHADFLLVGHYLKEADAVRLNIELVTSQTNELVLRESIEVKYENTFKLQDIVAKKVLRRLKVQFPKTGMDAMQADAPANALAHEYYLRGVSFATTLAENRLAVEMIEQSLKLDPAFAPAYAELGYRLRQEASYHMLGEESHRRAESAYRKALSLNRNQLSALLQLSTYYIEIGKHQEAADMIQQMLRITPNNAMAHFGLSYLYRYVGMMDESLHELETALALDPRNPRFRSGGFTYIYHGDYEKALGVFKLDGKSAVSITWQGFALFLMGDREQALEYLDRGIGMDPETFVGLRFTAIRAFMVGEPEAGLHSLRRLEASLPSHSDSEHFYYLANAYGLLGEVAGCVRALRKAVGGGFFNYPAFLKDTLLDPVRDDAEVQKVLVEAREKHEAFKRNFALKRTN